MVNFVTSSYNPDLLAPLIDKIVDIPEVVDHLSFPLFIQKQNKSFSLLLQSTDQTLLKEDFFF